MKITTTAPPRNQRHKRYLKNLGNTVYRLRVGRRMTQEEMAEVMGVSQSYVAKIERAGAISASSKATIRHPSLEVLLNLSEYFGVSLDDSLGLETRPDILRDLPNESQELVLDLIERLRRSPTEKRWQALADSVLAIGGTEAVDAASKKLGVALKPSLSGEKNGCLPDQVQYDLF